MNPWLLGLNQRFGFQKWNVRKRKMAENMMRTAPPSMQVSIFRSMNVHSIELLMAHANVPLMYRSSSLQ